VIKLYTSSRQADSDVVVFSWEVGTAKQKREMRAKGDFSFIRKGLFKKVYRGEGKENPLIYLDKRGNPQYIYKMINAWGDSYRANEFYNTARKSVIDNGFLKVENEVSDATMVAYFEASTPSQITEPKPALTAPAGVTFVSPKVVKLRDGRNYGLGAVNATMLLDMGYSTDEAGDILKQICS
jgi:hypothetical protein